MAAMKHPAATALLVGSLTFIAAYAVLMTVAMLRFAYFSGPVPYLLYGLPIPFAIGLLAAMVAFRVKTSD